MLTATLAVAALFFAILVRFRGVVLAAMAICLIALPVGYLLVSALSPSKTDRKCPECGQDGLVPLVPGAPQGTRCTRCGRVDEAASTAYLDTEEPPS